MCIVSTPSRPKQAKKPQSRHFNILRKPEDGKPGLIRVAVDGLAERYLIDPFTVAPEMGHIGVEFRKQDGSDRSYARAATEARRLRVPRLPPLGQVPPS